MVFLVSSAGMGIVCGLLSGWLLWRLTHTNAQRVIIANINGGIRALVVAQDFSSLIKIYLKLVRAILRCFLTVSLATILSICPLVVGYIGVEKLLTFDEPLTPNLVYFYGGDQFANDFHAFIQRSGYDKPPQQNLVDLTIAEKYIQTQFTGQLTIDFNGRKIALCERRLSCETLRLLNYELLFLETPEQKNLGLVIFRAPKQFQGFFWPYFDVYEAIFFFFVFLSSFLPIFIWRRRS